MRHLGYSETDICVQLTLERVEFVKNNAQAVARKASEAYDGYEAALETWQASDEQATLPKPQPPSAIRPTGEPAWKQSARSFR